jgi:hypothetical protein
MGGTPGGWRGISWITDESPERDNVPRLRTLASERLANVPWMRTLRAAAEHPLNTS